MNELERQRQAHRERHKRLNPAAGAADTFPGPARPLLHVVEALPQPAVESLQAPRLTTNGMHFPMNEITRITKACANHFGLQCSDLLSSKRSQNIVRPRQIAMFLSKAGGKHSLPEIGRRIGGRDHTTVLYGIRAIDALVRSDWTVAFDVAAIEIKLDLARRS